MIFKIDKPRDCQIFIITLGSNRTARQAPPYDMTGGGGTQSATDFINSIYPGLSNIGH